MTNEILTRFDAKLEKLYARRKRVNKQIRQVRRSRAKQAELKYLVEKYLDQVDEKRLKECLEQLE